MEERRAYDVLDKMLAPRSRRRATEGRATAKEYFDLRKVTSPVLLHLLGKELRYPRLFLWRCLLTVGRFKRSIDACASTRQALRAGTRSKSWSMATVASS